MIAERASVVCQISKGGFYHKEVLYLGHVVSKEDIALDLEKI